MAKKREFYFKSCDGVNRIHTVEWSPEDGVVRAVLHIVHGMAERVERYDDFDNGEDGGEIRSFYFSNPDPYAKVKPRPDEAPKREFSFDEKGNIVVKNPSAFWLPDVKIVEEQGGTEYTATGSYEGTETLDKKLRRIME